jgi:hypothetical protein
MRTRRLAVAAAASRGRCWEGQRPKEGPMASGFTADFSDTADNDEKRPMPYRTFRPSCRNAASARFEVPRGQPAQWPRQRAIGAEAGCSRGCLPRTMLTIGPREAAVSSLPRFPSLPWSHLMTFRTVSRRNRESLTSSFDPSAVPPCLRGERTPWCRSASRSPS